MVIAYLFFNTYIHVWYTPLVCHCSYAYCTHVYYMYVVPICSTKEKCRNFSLTISSSVHIMYAYVRYTLTYLCTCLRNLEISKQP